MDYFPDRCSAVNHSFFIMEHFAVAVFAFVIRLNRLPFYIKNVKNPNVN